MLDILLQMQKKAPVSFSITAVNLDQKQPGFPEHVLPDYLRGIGADFHILEQDTYSVVTRVIPEGKTMCSLCSRLRRGALYTYAEQQGFTKIALGHHRDDLIHTFLLNQFFAGTTATMPPKLKSNDGRNTVIRPLAYAPEVDIARFAELMQFPIIPCDLCGSQENLQRKKVKRLVDELAKDVPMLRNSLLSAMGNVHPTHMLDKKLWVEPSEAAPVKFTEQLTELKLRPSDVA
jgi:tRNA 2-thiocytidine biosynthesis protein TtcA